MTVKSIVVTGSTRGIGRGLAAEFLKRGHHVTVSGRSQAAVDEAVAALAPLAVGGARVVGAPCDVADAAAVQRLWDTAIGAFGRVDAWINNAGLSHPRRQVGELRAADIDVVADTNLLGMPTEGVGVSNNGMPRMSAPTFEAARFTVAGGQTVKLAISIRY